MHKNTINKLLTNVEQQTIRLVIPPLQIPNTKWFSSTPTVSRRRRTTTISRHHTSNLSSRFSNKNKILLYAAQALTSLTTLFFLTEGLISNVRDIVSYSLNKIHFNSRRRQNCPSTLHYPQL